ncbi:MAG: hypothetical protein J6I95_06530 [Anaerotignum sp.]|nr:hypothetical protein [Anaerotignum sp.]
MKRRKLISRHRRERKHIIMTKPYKMPKKLDCSEKVVIMEKSTEVIAVEADYLWKQILKIMEENISPVSFETWVEPCKVRELLGNKLIIEVENMFFKEMLEKRYVSYMNNAIRELLASEAEIVIVTEQH